LQRKGTRYGQNHQSQFQGHRRNYNWLNGDITKGKPEKKSQADRTFIPRPQRTKATSLRGEDQILTKASIMLLFPLQPLRACAGIISGHESQTMSKAQVSV